MYGARGTDTTKALLFFSASGYSKQAVEYAKAVAIALYVYDPTGEVTKVDEPKASKVVRPRWHVSERQLIGLLIVVGVLAAGFLMSLVRTTSNL